MEWQKVHGDFEASLLHLYATACILFASLTITFRDSQVRLNLSPSLSSSRMKCLQMCMLELINFPW